MISQNLGVDLEASIIASSGGERRRAALTKLIAGSHDIVLLDEPTNHLDVEAIEWLETELKHSSKSFVIISHDRAFLSNLTTDTIWVDRGKARRCSVGVKKMKKCINLTGKSYLKAVGQLKALVPDGKGTRGV
jgi:ATP-binding cassette subfamily F protein uup